MVFLGQVLARASLLTVHIDGPLDAPAIVFSNSLLTDQHIWDRTIEEWKPSYPNRYRYLVYNMHGYASDPGRDVDIDLLADDIAAVLDQFDIEKCFAVVGGSIGGIAGLSFAIRYPARLERFVACDCNVASSETSTKAWMGRIELRSGSWEELADQTVKRWFSVSATGEVVEWVRRMIIAAHRSGFVRCVRALCKFDISDKIKTIQVPGACICGSRDGVLPATMRSAAQAIPGCTYIEVEDAGHLPMLDQPGSFVQALLSVLGPV